MCLQLSSIDRLIKKYTIIDLNQAKNLMFTIGSIIIKIAVHLYDLQ